MEHQGPAFVWSGDSGAHFLDMTSTRCCGVGCDRRTVVTDLGGDESTAKWKRKAFADGQYPKPINTNIKMELLILIQIPPVVIFICLMLEKNTNCSSKKGFFEYIKIEMTIIESKFT